MANGGRDDQNGAADDLSDSRAAPGEIPLDVIPLHSTNLLTVLDDGGVVRYESPAIERIFGFDQADLVGEPVAEYFHPDDREEVVEAFRDVVASDVHTVEAVEYRHERADGSYRWVESVASSDTTPGGHYVVNTRDVSDRKRRDRELRRKTERLDQFASVVAHDLRNPLNVAQGHLQQARQTYDDPDLDAVAQAHDRMQALTADLLTLARQGDRALEVDAVDLAALADRCWGTVGTQAGSLIVDTDATVQADESHLRQLLTNLLRNAVEHGSTSPRQADDAVEHGGDVTVTVGALDDGFYVADDGPGIPPEHADRVFDLGYTSSADGTGYGLAIAETVAEAHGWSVAVAESESGGARFEVTGVETADE